MRVEARIECVRALVGGGEDGRACACVHVCVRVCACVYKQLLENVSWVCWLVGYRDGFAATSLKRTCCFKRKKHETAYTHSQYRHRVNGVIMRILRTFPYTSHVPSFKIAGEQGLRAAKDTGARCRRVGVDTFGSLHLCLRVCACVLVCAWVYLCYVCTTQNLQRGFDSIDWFDVHPVLRPRRMALTRPLDCWLSAYLL